MKKKLSNLLCAVALVLGIFSFSTNASAVSPQAGEIISVSDTLYEPEQVVGYDSEKNYANGEIISVSETEAVVSEANETNDGITPYWYLYKDKTITAYYDSIGKVPETRYYEEFTGGYWYSGNLKLKSVVASGSGYSATFSGQLSAWVN